MPWRSVAAATAAVLVGIGLARFAYSPLLPVVIASGWFTPGQAAYLGAANLLGYLLGALLSKWVSGAVGLPNALRFGMAAAAASLLACCIPLPFVWFFGWRLISGIAGGVLMILAPPAVLPLVPAARRGLASGLVFTGVGLGIAASGTLVPLLLRQGLTVAWLGLGLISAVLTLLTWRAWPATPPPLARSTAPGRFGAVSLSYGLCAVGLVPHMVFLVDYVARGQGRGMAAGGLTWVLFGLGAISGPSLLGRLSDAVGAAATFRAGLLLEGVSVLALLWLRDPVISGLMVFGAGLLVPGITAVMLGRVQALAGSDPAARQRGWTEATVAWALGQAAAAYGLAWLYARTGNYAAVLGAALVAVLLAAAVELWIAAAGRSNQLSPARAGGRGPG